jgi:hypothetical protein
LIKCANVSINVCRTLAIVENKVFACFIFETTSFHEIRPQEKYKSSGYLFVGVVLVFKNLLKIF